VKRSKKTNQGDATVRTEASLPVRAEHLRRVWQALPSQVSAFLQAPRAATS
jgi:hypothetical protein